MSQFSFLSRSTLRIAAAAAAALALAGCSDLRRSIGVEKSVPDEFAVVTRAPLSLPPDLRALPEPRPGAPRPQEPTMRDMAAYSLTGRPVASAPAGGGEQALLAQAGVDRADPNIRATVNAEAAILADQDISLLERLLFSRTATPSGDVVNAAEEARRLAAAEAAGQPPTQGDTPIIRRRPQGPLEGIFD